MGDDGVKTLIEWLKAELESFKSSYSVDLLKIQTAHTDAIGNVNCKVASLEKRLKKLEKYAIAILLLIAGQFIDGDFEYRNKVLDLLGSMIDSALAF